MDTQELIKLFFAEFGYEDNTRFFFAPSRVNLIGEHTDYNGGYVLPAALTFGTWAIARPRNDGIYRLRSTNFSAKVDCALSEKLVYKKEDDWANYPKGVLYELIKMAGVEQSHLFTGADILFHGNTPNGAGLSSSASIELVTGLSLSSLAGLPVPMLELVKLAQRAENGFVGVNCGIMDQFAIGMGRENHAIMLKCDKLEYSYVPMKLDDYKIVITNTNKQRGLADSKYNERRRECEQGFAQIKNRLLHAQSLGDVGYTEWEKVRKFVVDEVIRNRLEHVISENERVKSAMKSLQKSDLSAFGDLMKRSHESLRDLYEVTGFELDTLYEEASRVPGCIGTRMTGAGFGGCNVSLVKEESVVQFKKSVSENYTSKTTLTPTFYVCEIGNGAREISKVGAEGGIK
ncbi:galactokinase [Peribacillus cavernae]|uniref:Galactokinase n=1 Tax=Peribacillus cavernae TaxID=1674310 RepID=A0A3S0W3X2_9BACI|nr:galactokinase [Peribacillus cavernae]MDQ0219998.1 galactokinase [Peribacillus cavernae]RUQ32062.1 galactokinase [Peribacillus cavernae]